MHSFSIATILCIDTLWYVLLIDAGAGQHCGRGFLPVPRLPPHPPAVFDVAVDQLNDRTIQDCNRAEPTNVLWPAVHQSERVQVLVATL
jgi:hypothetical protein